MKDRKNCLHLPVYHLGNSDLEIHDMADCQRSKIFSICDTEHHNIQFEDFLRPFYRRSLNPSLSVWRTSYSKAVSSLLVWLGGLSSPQVLGPSSWHEFPLTGVDKKFHFLLATLADQIPYGIISPWFCPVVANSCLKLEWMLWLSVAWIRWMGCRDGGAGSGESSILSVSSRHQTLPFPVRKEPSPAPFQLSFVFSFLWPN